MEQPPSQFATDPKPLNGLHEQSQGRTAAQIEACKRFPDSRSTGPHLKGADPAGPVARPLRRQSAMFSIRWACLRAINVLAGVAELLERRQPHRTLAVETLYQVGFDQIVEMNGADDFLVFVDNRQNGY